MTLENCTIRGTFIADGAKTDEENVGSWKGFYVAPNSKLVLKQCNVINFDVGLRVRSSGQVIASASEITMCNIGILVRYFVNVKMITLLYFRPPHTQAEESTSNQISNCDVKLCKEYAICVEMDSDSIGETMLGGLELLSL